MPPFISCSACGCASKASESSCPHCGTELRLNGVLQKTAVAIALGLAVAACGDDTGPGGAGGDASGGFASDYGVAATGGGGADTTSGGGGSGGEGGFAPKYGVPATGGGGAGGN